MAIMQALAISGGLITSIPIEILLLGGGGGGGSTTSGQTGGAGGGGGGQLLFQSKVITRGSYPIVVGAGHQGAAAGDTGPKSPTGTESTAFEFYAGEGGYGGISSSTALYRPGGRIARGSLSTAGGGGGAAAYNSTSNAGGAGASSNNGAAAWFSENGGGGGGASGNPGVNGNGGQGYQLQLWHPGVASSIYLAAGGGGGSGDGAAGRPGGTGAGSGGGPNANGGSATAATGAGGGGGGAGGRAGGNGATGRVMIRHLESIPITLVGGSTTVAGGWRFYTFTASGSLIF